MEQDTKEDALAFSYCKHKPGITSVLVGKGYFGSQFVAGQVHCLGLGEAAAHDRKHLVGQAAHLTAAKSGERGGPRSQQPLQDHVTSGLTSQSTSPRKVLTTLQKHKPR